MRDNGLERYLRQSLQQETKRPAGLEETIGLCTGIMREQRLAKKSREEPRIGFVQYLTDIFRFEGVPVMWLHAAVLLIICLMITANIDRKEYIPVFMPFFVLAAIPVMFRCQYYGMDEIEAVTRASGPQIVLAKLILAGASDLICMTIFIFYEIRFKNACCEIRQLILYCLVPYLTCLVGMLRLIRLHRKESMQACIVLMLGSCVFWGMLAKTMPWLYNTSAFGIWIAAFAFFAVFFIKEIAFIISTGKEGKMYGIIV